MSFLQSPLEPQQSDEVCFVFCPKRLSQGSAALSPVPPESWHSQGIGESKQGQMHQFLFI